ncbi:hypothetical protein EIN_032030 [Entamoeba invadens IP1]|uniref:Uncharacterized protein n=1 Tax=Entamoeba invadens IP1 TaxID=370355 RepID=A0A0A1TY58_ENTIV|nr:hypothetical protein EIN_032030 [Entamoeba invadens IP1]ELP86452.1 hypothetical protein EIN_032030 [Entamoeba invadens IP1]|eukprot:XP_004185798.1 hypothetical protein EIN_032030 [Entamoeba invadens IP1]
MLLLCVLFIVSQSQEMDCIQTDGTTLQKFSLTYTLTNAGCPNTRTGKIYVNQLTTSNASISYTITNLKTPNDTSSSISPLFEVSEGTYKIDILYTFETRDFELENGTSTYQYCHIILDDLKIISTYETISNIDQTVVNSPHCAGNYGKVTCTAKTTGTLLNYSLSGVETKAGTPEGVFEDLAVGTYRCVVTSDHCSSQGKEFEVDYEKNCSGTDIWLDRQLYGEGKSFFIAGVVLILVGILMNLIICICCCKLCCVDSKPEKVAQKLEKKKKKKKQREAESEMK